MDVCVEVIFIYLYTVKNFDIESEVSISHLKKGGITSTIQQSIPIRDLLRRDGTNIYLGRNYSCALR
jgi:hypothetical protein